MKSSVATSTLPSKKRSKQTLTVRAEEQDGNHVPTDQASRDNHHDRFFWTYTEEPHRTRRMAIIKAHPEVITFALPTTEQCTYNSHKQVTKLCGPEPLTKYVVTFVVALQVLCAYLLRDSAVLSWPFFLTAYIIGATANQNLFLAIHEISHNLAFRSPLANRVFAVFANLPIGIPYSASFRVGAPDSRDRVIRPNIQS